MNDVEYIVVQAGGKGTRMGRLTANKPKALVPLDGKPILFHLFSLFPDKHFIIIGDYMIDVLRRYLDAFAKVKYSVVDACGNEGTCAGINTATSLIPTGEPFLVIWSDLILPVDFLLPENVIDSNIIGLSRDFRCRWSYRSGHFEESSSTDAGVAGFFLFKNKEEISDVPHEGEFVRWLQQQHRMEWREIGLYRTKEYGTLAEYLQATTKTTGSRCRPFNRIELRGDGMLVKTGIDAQGRELAAKECAWYKYVHRFGFASVPRIYSFDPIVMDRINGNNVFEYDIPLDDKRDILRRIIASLKKLHSMACAPADYSSVYDAYVGKTINRLNTVRDLIPFSDRRHITINGVPCKNVYFAMDQLKDMVASYKCDDFRLIHGDNTFSNILLDEAMEPVFIDPRGYFGRTDILGDPNYDWAKLYYSIVGNYDRFNLGRFSLSIGSEGIDISVESNNWEELEDDFFSLIGDEVNEHDIRLLHGVIWLSLTTYSWEDYDSICGAFYNGLWFLKDILH